MKSFLRTWLFAIGFLATVVGPVAIGGYLVSIGYPILGCIAGLVLLAAGIAALVEAT
jgi:hypothetical protein